MLEAAPELTLGSPTYGWTYAAYRSMQTLMQAEVPSRVQVPLLIFSAGNDRVISNRATEEFANPHRLGTALGRQVALGRAIVEPEPRRVERAGRHGMADQGEMSRRPQRVPNAGLGRLRVSAPAQPKAEQGGGDCAPGRHGLIVFPSTVS